MNNASAELKPMSKEHFTMKLLARFKDAKPVDEISKKQHMIRVNKYREIDAYMKASTAKKRKNRDRR